MRPSQRASVLALLVAAVLPGLVLAQKSYRTASGYAMRVETVVEGLEIPWGLAFDGKGDLYITERPGRLSVVRKGTRTPRLITEIDDVSHRGEGGLMGLALHPDFDRNGYLYVSYTTTSLLMSSNMVVRLEIADGAVRSTKTIIEDLPGSFVHNGCRIKFGPDGKLYVTAGDAAKWDNAQKMDSFGGKILRLNDDGSVPADNPFPGSPIYVVGVRNPQGIAWDPVSRRMFQTDHGPSGFEGRGGGGDEVNIIEPGENYGWPVITHNQTRDGLVSPLLEYSPAVAPAGATFYGGKRLGGLTNAFLFGCLRGERLQVVYLDAEDRGRVAAEEGLFKGDFGRIRDVVEGPDGAIYFCTSNRDGRGKVRTGDDKVLRIVPDRQGR